MTVLLLSLTDEIQGVIVTLDFLIVVSNGMVVNRSFSGIGLDSVCRMIVCADVKVVRVNDEGLQCFCDWKHGEKEFDAAVDPSQRSVCWIAFTCDVHWMK